MAAQENVALSCGPGVDSLSACPHVSGLPFFATPSVPSNLCTWDTALYGCVKSLLSWVIFTFFPLFFPPCFSFWALLV